MNKAARAAFVFLLLSSTSFAQELELTVARLVGCSWANCPELGSEEAVRLLGGLFIRFEPDGSFRAIAGPGQGGERVIPGRYTVERNRIALSRMTEAGLVPWLADGVLKYGAESYRYPYYYIEFAGTSSSPGEAAFAPFPADDRILLDLTTTLVKGSAIRFGEVAALVVNAEGKTTQVLNTRLAPSAQAERAVFETADGTASSLPKGAVVRVLARTVATESIGGVDACWYFVEYWPDPSGPIQAWVFGGYLSVE